MSYREGSKLDDAGLESGHDFGVAVTFVRYVMYIHACTTATCS